MVPPAITENFWESVEMKQADDQNRTETFEPGYSEVGKYHAMNQPHTECATGTEEDSLSFYLGLQSRMTLSDSVIHPSSSSP
jgi:hypothetical protein